ncbi:hypothetical protein [Pareuzebyella sediminis]|uniref:hypothetical protein n=1 Tax=Pareuzebyella sediminis TaxID=2607998 RepID=UPI0011F07212|nr:hypothetical protein [Pareuzebyella sediminis]
MPNPYIDNSERWLALAEIDYLIQFVKAWIPFNAWYMNMYPTLNRDRIIIEEIKSNPNLFRDKIIALINGADSESIIFKGQLARLHQSLETNYIPNADKRISFNSVTVETNPITSETYSFRQWIYKVELTRSGNTTNINSLITNAGGITQYTYDQRKFNIEDLTNHATNNSSLNESQMRCLLKTYERINPKKPISLISTNRKGIEAGDIVLINDVDKIVKGLIEIIYKLRNVLFHGELIPNNTNKKVYEPAFYILKTLIQSLN